MCGFAACKDAVDPGGTPTTIEIVTAAPANGVVNSAVTPGPSFLVKNENGQAMATNVTIALTAGGGALTGQPAKSNSGTTNSGTTSIGTWTLGKTAGANTVTVTVGSLTPVAFTVTGNAAAPYKVVEVNPPATLRSGLANAVVTGPIVVAVADTFNNAIAGRVVNFSILGGGGTLSGNLTATTDANGQATAPTWRLGKSADGAGAQKVRAISGALPPADISATVQSSYNIVVRFFDAASMTPAQQTLFTNAAQRIMGAVTGDLADVQLTNQPISGCVAGQGNLTEVVDDVIVYATIKAIDGPGQILAVAGPCFIRSGASCTVGCAMIPLMGVMTFDIADLNSLSGGGSLQEIITHEMLHVLGFGSLWNAGYFNVVTGAGTLDPRYTAPSARAACAAFGGTVSCANTVPVEGCADRPQCQPPDLGGGTRDAHWREATFGSELMTGFLDANPNPFSSMTIGSLADLGYVVNTGDNDPYTIFAGSIMANSLRAPAQQPARANWEHLNHVPLYSIDRGGNVRLLRKAQ